MKFHRTVSLNLLCMAAIGFAAGVMAQTPQTSTEAKEEMSSAKKDPLAIQSSGPEEWTKVKGHDKGFLTKTDPLPNSWIAMNFAKCDADQNGKVTEAEYTKCQKM